MQNITQEQTQKQVQEIEPVNGKDKSLEAEIIKGVEASTASKKKNNVINLPTSNPTVLQALSENEFGDSALFVMLNQDKLVYDHAAKEWYYWNDNFWRLDKKMNAIKSINGVIQLYGEQLIYERLAQKQADQDGDQTEADQHKATAKHLSDRISSLRTVKRAETILKLSSRGVDALCITGEEWDQLPMKFCCRNGCVDLKTGDFAPGEPADFLRTAAPINWLGFDTPCPNWRKFMLEMNDNDQAVVDCLQRLLGYGITGLNIDHVLPIFWGSAGRNGKGTLFETLKYILGDFAFKAPASFLIDHVNKAGSNTPDAVTMALYGKRLVWLSETNQSDRLDVAKAKELVGGDTLSARSPYGKRQVEFSSTHLMLIITNMRPRVPANDKALWQRLLLIPLKNSFIENPSPDNPHEFKADKHLGEKLRKEASGILAWLVEGCMLWQEYGIMPPKNICAATEEYRQSEDIIGDFIQECCMQDHSKDSPLKIERKKLYEEYRIWCASVGHLPLAKKRFLDDVSQRFAIIKVRGLFYFSKLGLLL